MSNFLDVIGLYYKNMLGSALSDWLILALALAAFYGMLMIFLKVFFRRAMIPRTQSIYISIMSASGLVLFFIVLYCLYNWQFTSYYVLNPNQMIHLLTVIILLLIPFIFILYYRTLFERNHLAEIVGFQHSKNLENEKSRKATKTFNKHKFWLMLPLLSFFILLIPQNKRNLVSVVIDNSSSMGQIGVMEDSPIEIARNSLINTLNRVYPKTIITITWLSESASGNYVRSINQLVGAETHMLMNAETAHFEYRQNAIGHLHAMNTINSTPLFEGIWANFLYNKGIVGQYQPEQTALIIITDGDDTFIPVSEYSYFSLCSNAAFDEIFPEVSIINIGGDLSSPFFNNAAICNYFIEEDGLSRRSFDHALKYSLRHFFKDYTFIYSLLIFLGIILIAVFITPPKKY